MAACPKCGSALSQGAAFCTNCGVPVLPPLPATHTGATATAGLTPNAAGALCYLLGLVTGIAFLLIEPYKRDQSVRFHAFQSIFFSVVVIAFNMVWSSLFLAAVFSGGFLWTIFSLIGRLIGLAIFVFWLFLMYRAYKKEPFQIPLIGEMATRAAKQDS